MTKSRLKVRVPSVRLVGDQRRRRASTPEALQCMLKHREETPRPQDGRRTTGE